MYMTWFNSNCVKSKLSIELHNYTHQNELSKVKVAIVVYTITVI